MKKFLLLGFIFLLLTSQLFADEFIVDDFKQDPTSLAARTNKRLDANDDACALILVNSSLLGVGIVVNTGVVGNVSFKEGYYWVYVSAGTRRISFFKDGFDRLNYDIPMPIESSNVYVLSLKYKRTDIETAVNTMGFVLINSEPEGADVYIEGEPTGKKTPFQNPYNEGYYRFTLIKTLYEDFSGDFTIIPNETTKINTPLVADYGSLKLSFSPGSEATIIIDNLSQTTQSSPHFVNLLSLGTHTLSISKDEYVSYQQEFTISKGKTTNLNIELEPTFGSIQINTQAESDIYIDRAIKGKGSYTGRLMKGEHLVEIKKDNYYSQSRQINIKVREIQKEEFTLQPKQGVLSVMTSPAEANIYLNGESQGQTPKFINNLLVGTYNLKLQKQGFATVEKQIEITENQTTTINETLADAIEVQITSNPSGAKLYIDNQYYGLTPQSLSLSFTSYIFKLQKEGYKELINDKTISTITNRLNFEMGAIVPQTLTSSVAGIEFVLVKGGTFQMGSNDGDANEKPVHTVTLSNFYMGKYEVTQRQWSEVMGSNPSKFKGDDLPVESVSWNDIQEFIRKLNQKAGKKFRLPTEAEWEYAAKGGASANSARSTTYSGSNNIEDIAWYKSNSAGKTHPVGRKQANELGIYDMSGNVWEWCNDWYGAYSGQSPNNPQGPSSGSLRVWRGGSWFFNASYCRVAYRYYLSPDSSIYFIGFRLAHSSD